MSDSPSVRHLSVSVGDEGQRLDNFLLRELKGVPRTWIYRVVRKGEVRVNRKRSRPEQRLHCGDTVRVPPVRVAAPGAPVTPPEPLLTKLEQAIVYEDDEILVINKPAGLAVHGGSGLQFGVVECLRQSRPDCRRLELIHRLDRDTSGLLLIAKRRSSLLRYQNAFREGRVHKFYHAWVVGCWPDELFEVTAPLKKNVLSSGERMVRVSADGKQCLTRFRKLREQSGCSLLEASPVTGRTHQIRVHVQFAGHPVLGDRKYQHAEDENLARQLGVRRMCLHALRLEVHHEHEAPLLLQAPWEFEQALPAEGVR